jgi:hypothetical protein
MNHKNAIPANGTRLSAKATVLELGLSQAPESYGSAGTEIRRREKTRISKMKIRCRPKQRLRVFSGLLGSMLRVSLHVVAPKAGSGWYRWDREYRFGFRCTMDIKPLDDDPSLLSRLHRLVDNVITTIHVKRFSGDEPRGIMGQERRRKTHVIYAHETAHRSFRPCFVQQIVELWDA